MNEVSLKFLEMIERASPTLWAAAKSQVRCSMVTDCIWIVALLLCSVVLLYGAIWFFKKGNKKEVNHDECGGYHTGGAFSALGVIIFFIIIVFYVADLVQIGVAPDFKALQSLMALLPKPK